jgi:hypothetical protein
MNHVKLTPATAIILPTAFEHTPETVYSFIYGIAQNLYDLPEKVLSNPLGIKTEEAWIKSVYNDDKCSHILTHGTVYLTFPYGENSHPAARSYPSIKYHDDRTQVYGSPYPDNNLYVTAPLKYIMDKKYMDDLEYMERPKRTNLYHHPLRLTVRFDVDLWTAWNIIFNLNNQCHKRGEMDIRRYPIMDNGQLLHNCNDCIRTDPALYNVLSNIHASGQSQSLTTKVYLTNYLDGWEEFFQRYILSTTDREYQPLLFKSLFLSFVEQEYFKLDYPSHKEMYKALTIES